MNALMLSRLLGCFGLGLGTAEVSSPGCVSAWLGLPRRPETIGWFGIRTILTALMVLMRPRVASGPTLQAVGGAIDMMMLLPALSEHNPRRETARSAFMVLAGITALDALCAALLVAPPRTPPRPAAVRPPKGRNRPDPDSRRSPA